MFQSEDFDEDIFNDILDSDNSNTKKDFIFNSVNDIFPRNNNENDIFQLNKPSTSRSNENIINLFSKPKSNGLFPSKSPKRNHRKVVQRKFPGPAGLLPENKIEINLKNLDENDTINKTIAPDEIMCSQISENCFKESPWIDMCQDYYLEKEKLCFPDKYSIFWAKTNAMSKQLLGQKTPFLAAIIKNIDYSTKNPMVTLKDPTGEMSGTLHHEVWEEFSEKLNAGSIIVLQQVGVLITLKKYYLNITPNNIITIYHFKEPLSLTQSQNLTEKRNFEITKLKNLSNQDLKNSIENFKRNFRGKNDNENDNPFFKQTNFISSPLFSPGTRSILSKNQNISIFTRSKSFSNSSVQNSPQCTYNNCNAAVNNSNLSISNSSKGVQYYSNQSNSIQKGLTNEFSLTEKNNVPDQNLSSKCSENFDNVVKRRKLDSNCHDLGAKSLPSIVAATTNCLKTSIFQNDEVDVNQFSDDIISETPDVSGKLTRFNFLSVVNAAENKSKSVCNSKSSIKFVDNNKCDKIETTVSQNKKNIFCNDNFVEGLEESFLEDF